MIGRIVCVLCSVVFLGGVTIALMHFLKGSNLSRKLVNALLPLSQIALSVYIFIVSFVYNLPIWLCVVTTVLSIACGIGDIALFKAFATAERKDLAEGRSRLLENQIKIQSESQKQLMYESEKAQVVRAEVALELDEVERLLDQREAKQAACGLMHAVDKMTVPSQFYCDHLVVDALVAKKQQLCEQANIRTTFLLSVPRDLAMPNLELCAIFSNIFDNALHACEQVPVQERFITLRTQTIGSFFMVSLENSCVATVSYPHNALRFQKRTKTPRLTEHGWGLFILEELAARHDGSLKTEYLDGTFRTTIMFNLSY